nr:hypothetical protein [Tanacetum cinerariifolium]
KPGATVGRRGGSVRGRPGAGNVGPAGGPEKPGAAARRLCRAAAAPRRQAGVCGRRRAARRAHHPRPRPGAAGVCRLGAG